MRSLLHILLFAGVVLFGFNTSLANFEGEDKNNLKKDSISGANKVLKDSVVKGKGVQVGDTLVFDDYDEDEPSRSADRDFSLVWNDLLYPMDELPITNFSNLNLMPTNDEAKHPLDEQDQTTPARHSPEWQLYPNPVSPNQGSEVWIEHHLTGNVQLTIVDQSGRVVQNHNFTGNKFSFQTPSAGIYHLLLSSQTQQLSKQLVVR